jgi:hypothetical protein
MIEDRSRNHCKRVEYSLVLVLSKRELCVCAVDVREVQQQRSVGGLLSASERERAEQSIERKRK